MKHNGQIVSILLAIFSLYPCVAQDNGPEWVRTARVAAYELSSDNAASVVEQAQASHVSGIEVDNDITGRYDSFNDPSAKLQAIRQLAREAHRAGNHAFVYIAGTECITPDSDKSKHTLFKDHPDWVQRNLAGAPAMFHSGDAFWIAKGDEDVWISPYAMKWRRMYMKRIRQIAATGIDGIYIDVPYWMTHFKGWDRTWASFDDYTIAAFLHQTGIDARKDLKLGDFSDENFRRWVEFRMETMTDFLSEIDHTAKAVNPQIVTIPEIYPGIEEAAVRVGIDPYRIYPVVAAVAHEYEFGEGSHTAALRTPLDWLLYQTGIASFRAFAEGKASWLLNYSWDANAPTPPREAMLNLAMSELMAGANVWDAAGHVMSGSNDLATRTELFAWIREHEQTFYHPRTPIQPVGVYFSPATRDAFPEDYLSSYQGLLILLMQAHREYQIVTPRTLAAFHGETLVLPEVKVLDSQERNRLKEFVSKGGRLIINGTDATGLGEAANMVRFPTRPDAAYMTELRKDTLRAQPSDVADFLRDLGPAPRIAIKASAGIVTHIAAVDGAPHVFFANFKGLVRGGNAVQEPESHAKVMVRPSSSAIPKAYFLPFLGQVREIPGVQADGQIAFDLPDIQKGAVFWLIPGDVKVDAAKQSLEKGASFLK